MDRSFQCAEKYNKREREERESFTEELLLFILTPGLGQRLPQLHAHGVETLEDSLLPLALHLPHVAERLPHPAAVLLVYPLLQAFTPHQVEHAVLQPPHGADRGQLSGAILTWSLRQKLTEL